MSKDNEMDDGVVDVSIAGSIARSIAFDSYVRVLL